VRDGRFIFIGSRSAASHDAGVAGLAVRFVVNVAALWLAQALLPGFDIDGWAPLLLGAAIFGGVNAMIKPVVSLLALPITCLTLGLFALVVNALMLALTAWIAGLFDLAFTLDGFWPALFGALIIAIVSTLLGWRVTPAILGPLRESSADGDEWP